MARSILVVEDSRTQAERLRFLLEDQGYEVRLAQHGQEGLQRVQEEAPDLIISDIVMPLMDGYAFCQAVKSVEATRRIPFVFLTDRNLPADILLGFERGADNFITKPFEDTYLLERVQRIFEHLQRRQEGHVEAEIPIRVGGHELAISADKQQIIELLLATFAELHTARDKLVQTNQELVQLTADLQAAKERAEASDRLKSEFLASLSHELRTPLNAILGFTGMLLMRLPGPLTPDQETQLQTVERSTQHLLSLINDLLDLARIESGKVEVTLELTVCNQVVQDVAQTLRPLAERKGLALEVRLPSEEIVARTDRRALSQILINLVNNAIKFTEQGVVRLEISHTQTGDRTWTEFSVVDTGPGITAEDQAKLFRLFAQVGADRRRRAEGTGLGLHISQKLAVLLGGHIVVQSAPGTGSRFTVVLETPG